MKSEHPASRGIRGEAGPGRDSGQTEFRFLFVTQSTGRNITVTRTDSVSRKRYYNFLDTKVLDTMMSDIRQPQT